MFGEKIEDNFFELEGSAPKVITRFLRVYSKLSKQSDLEIKSQIFFLVCCLTVVPHIVHNPSFGASFQLVPFYLSGIYVLKQIRHFECGYRAFHAFVAQNTTCTI